MPRKHLMTSYEDSPVGNNQAAALRGYMMDLCTWWRFAASGVGLQASSKKDLWSIFPSNFWPYFDRT